MVVPTEPHIEYVDIGKYFGGSSPILLFVPSIISFIRSSIISESLSYSEAIQILIRQLMLNGFNSIRIISDCINNVDEKEFIDRFQSSPIPVFSLSIAKALDVCFFENHAKTSPLMLVASQPCTGLVSLQQPYLEPTIKCALKAGISVAFLSQHSWMHGERLHCFIIPVIASTAEDHPSSPATTETTFLKTSNFRTEVAAGHEELPLDTKIERIGPILGDPIPVDGGSPPKLYNQMKEDLDPVVIDSGSTRHLTFKISKEQWETRQEQRIMTRISTYASSLHGASSCFNQVLRADPDALKAEKKKKKEPSVKSSSKKADLIKQENERRIMEADLARQQKILAVARESVAIGRTIDAKLAVLDQLRIDRSKSPPIYTAFLMEKIRIYADAWKNFVLMRSSDLASSTNDADFYYATKLFELIFEIVDDRCLFSSISFEQMENVLLPSFAMFSFLEAARLLIREWCDMPQLAKERSKLLKGLEEALVKASYDVGKYKVRHSYVRFQLLFCGHLTKRAPSLEDPRVRFRPDPWQVELLDVVDSDHSALISAPTSSGKTFICYYAMERVLRRSDTGVVLYVAPNKALMDQVVADVYARFNHKQYGRGSSNRLLGYLTDFDAFHPWEAQVLVTFPEVIERYVTSPLFEDFIDRIEYVILDEIHTISEEGKSASWEKILLRSKAPVLALSATIGNRLPFFGWLASIQKVAGIPCRLIHHEERYSDLQRHIFAPSADDDDDASLLVSVRKPTGSSKIMLWHPLLSLSLEDFNRVLPSDFCLLPGDAVRLADALRKVADCQLPPELDYEKMPLFYNKLRIERVDAKKYSKDLMAYLTSKNLNEASLAEIQTALGGHVLRYLGGGDGKEGRRGEGSLNFHSSADGLTQFLLDSSMELLTTMSAENRLPAIIFHFDRNFCTRLAVHVIEQLELAEGAKRAKNAKEERSKIAMLERSQRAARRVRDVEKKSSRDSWIEESMETESITDMVSALTRSQGPDPDLVFYDQRFKVGDTDLADLLETQGVIRTMTSPDEKVLLRGLYRGIGVHHRGVPKRYLSLVEHLFRLGHLQVVVAGATLALGINMPCKSVIFAGSSPISLTPIDFRQASGRAGRRNYDALGHVIFWGLPKPRIDFLLTSEISSIRGDISSFNGAMALQLFHLKHEPLFLHRMLTKPLFTISHRGSCVVATTGANDDGEDGDCSVGNDDLISGTLLDHLRRLKEALTYLGLLHNGQPTVYARLALLIPSHMPACVIVGSLVRLGWLNILCKDYDNSPDQSLKHLLLFLCRFVQPRYIGIGDDDNADDSDGAITTLPGLHDKLLNQQLHSDLVAYNAQVLRIWGGSSSLAAQVNNRYGALVFERQFLALHRESASSLLVAAPLFTMPDQVTLSAYIWDYYQHANIERITGIFGVSEMELWQDLNEFKNFLAQLNQMVQHEAVSSAVTQKAVAELFLLFDKRFRAMWA